MVDRNKNGIDDALERKRAASYASGSPTVEAPKTSYKAASQGQRGQSAPASTPAPAPGRNLFQQTIDNSLFGLGAFFGTNKKPAPKKIGAGLGGALGGAAGRLGPAPVQERELTLADYLKMATELIGSDGGGGVPMANYDPQRGTARSQAAENDARLEAMYRQLRGSIDADAPVIQQGYQQAIDSTAQNSATAQQQTQAATDSANSRNNEVLANLGIQQAQGNIIQNGTDLNTQTAQRIADQATRGQAAGDRLVSNQATALTHNTNIGNAAGLEGNLQRASNNARLQALLAEIDMAEQNENAGRAAQNASLGRSGLGQQLELAQFLMGNDTDERRYQDDLAIQATKAAAGQQSLPSLDEILQGFAARGIKIPEDPRQLVGLLDAGRKLSF